MEAADICSRHEDLLRQAEDIVNKQPQMAKDLCEQVLRELTSSSPTSLRVKALYNLAMGLSWMNQKADAVNVLHETLELAKKSGDAPYQRRAMSELGLYMAQSGKVTEAIGMLESANKVMEAPHAATLSMLGHLYGAAGDVKGGELSYKQSLEVQGVGQDYASLASEIAPDMDPMRKRRIRSTMHVLIHYGADLCGCTAELPGEWPVVDTFRGSELLQAGLQIARALHDFHGVEFALNFLGHASEKSGSLDEAIGYFKEAQHNLEERWSNLREDAFRISSRDDFFPASITAALQRTFLANHEPMLALQAADLARARSLLALMRQSCDGPRLLDPSGERLANAAWLRKSVVVYYSILSPCSVATWVISPRGTLRGFKTLDLSHSVTDKEDLSKYVETFRGAMAVPTRGATTFDYCVGDCSDAGKESIHDEQDRTNVHCRRRSLKLTKQHLGACYLSLWAPIAEWVTAGESIIIVPDKELYMLPFAALWDDQSGQYLIERHEISWMPSLLVGDALEQLPVCPEELAAALVMGATDFTSNVESGELPPLPKVADEVQNIATECSKAGVACKLLLDQDMTLKEVRDRLMEPSLFVHFATHGILDKAALALHDANLHMQDISSIHVRARIAVLSACSTARGQLSSDGVIGLSRSFLAAGLPALLVTLWNVGDESTSAFMRLFYQEWLGHKQSLSGAVQKAMCHMLRSSNPEYLPHQWAAFTLLGAAQSD